MTLIRIRKRELIAVADRGSLRRGRTRIFAPSRRGGTWTATAEEILAKVALTQTNIRKLVDNNAK
jgi:hypothetical protein